MDAYTDYAHRVHGQSGYPYGFCNVASKELQLLLSERCGIQTEFAFTYKTKGNGHTFLLGSDGTIYDPTFGQYASDYDWLITESYPCPVLQGNIMTGNEYMLLQAEWYEEGVYNEDYETESSESDEGNPDIYDSDW